MCGWSEPNLDHVEGLPQCVVNAAGGGRGEYDPPCPPAPLFDGTLFRVISCELEYGPLNCDFVFRGSNEPYLDEATMPAVGGGRALGGGGVDGGCSEGCWAYGIMCGAWSGAGEVGLGGDGREEQAAVLMHCSRPRRLQ